MDLAPIHMGCLILEMKYEPQFEAWVRDGGFDIHGASFGHRAVDILVVINVEYTPDFVEFGIPPRLPPLQISGVPDALQWLPAGRARVNMDSNLGMLASPIVEVVGLGHFAFGENTNDASGLPHVAASATRLVGRSAHASVGSVARTYSAGLVVGTPP